MRRRIWTADRMRRHGMESHIICPLCDQDDETADHIATGCVFAKEVWFYALSRCGMVKLELYCCLCAAATTSKKRVRLAGANGCLDVVEGA